MKGLFGLGPRERRLALAASVVIGCWLVVSFVIQPLWDRANDLKLRAQSQSEKLDSLGRLLADGSAIEREYQRLAAYFTQDDGAQSTGSFFNELESMASHSGVLLNLKPKTTKQVEGASRIEVELDLEGSQENLLAFLDALLHAERLILVQRLRISSVPAKTQSLRMSLVVQQIYVKGP